MKPKNLQNQKYEVVEMISKMRSRPEAAAIRDSPASWNEFERENQSTYHHRVDEHQRCSSVDRSAGKREIERERERNSETARARGWTLREQPGFLHPFFSSPANFLVSTLFQRANGLGWQCGRT